MCGSWLLVRAEYVPDDSEPYVSINRRKGCVKSGRYRVASGAQCVAVEITVEKLTRSTALYIHLSLRHAT
eukprot:6223093-Prymnesium_polylepis.1